MPAVCLYFQVHQPYRLRHYGIFDIGSRKSYFDDALNREVCKKVASKCYLPANTLLLELLKANPEFRITFSISGVALEQFSRYAPQVISGFKKLAATGQVEFLAETYYHSLASLFDKAEFKAQIAQHGKALKELLGVSKPTVFRNTELIYSDAIGEQVADLGFKGVLAEGADFILKNRSPNQVYKTTSGLGLLTKNYQLSDDIAFRFSNKQWKEWPLTATRFASWIHSQGKNAETINLFMDYETIGEHQWKETGIFDFFRELPAAITANKAFTFATPSQVLKVHQPKVTLSYPRPVSWADTERDLSAWLGNPMQDGTAEWLYQLGAKVKATKNPVLIDSWRKLQTSDHFYYMCTKYWADGDVHRYFSSYKSPHEPYTIMNNVLSDLEMHLRKSER